MNYNDYWRMANKANHRLSKKTREGEIAHLIITAHDFAKKVQSKGFLELPPHNELIDEKFGKVNKYLTKILIGIEQDEAAS